jgi:hypothetical protein
MKVTTNAPNPGLIKLSDSDPGIYVSSDGKVVVKHDDETAIIIDTDGKTETAGDGYGGEDYDQEAIMVRAFNPGEQVTFAA